MATRKQYTDKQRTELLAKIAKLRKDGMSAAKASAKVGVSVPTYYSWIPGQTPKKGSVRVSRSNTMAGTTSKVMNISLPKGKNQPMVLLIGQPGDINTALSNLAAVLR
jgi:hypothetical protein